MGTRKEAYRLTITLEDDGAKVEATYRTRVFGDDGKVDAKFEPAIEPARLSDLGDQFPWAEFIPPATQAVLLKSETDIAAKKSAEGAQAVAEKAATEMLAAVDSALVQLNAQVDALNEVKAKFSPKEE